MSKTLKDLNWNLYLVNLILAISSGLAIVVAGEFTVKGGLAVILGLVIKDNIAFFSEAKKIFTKPVKHVPRKR